MNTPDILTEYLQFGGPAAFTIRATIAATGGAELGRLRRLRALRERRPPGQRGEHRQREVRVQAARLGRRRSARPLARAVPHACSTASAREHPGARPAAQPPHRTGATTTRSSSTRKHLTPAHRRPATPTPSSSSRTSTRTRCARRWCTSTLADLGRRPRSARSGRRPDHRARPGRGAQTTTSGSTRSPSRCTSCTSSGATHDRRSTHPHRSTRARRRSPEGRTIRTPPSASHPGSARAESPAAWTVIRARRPLAQTRRPPVLRRRQGRVAAQARRAPASGRAPGRATPARTTASHDLRRTAPDWIADDPYRFAPDRRRGRPAPDRRGPPRAALERARRPRTATTCGRHGHVVRRLGARTPRRARRRRLQRLGRRRPRHAPPRRQSASGSCSSPGSAPGTTYKFEMLTRHGGWGMKADPMARLHRGAAGDGLGRHSQSATSGATATG